MTDAECVVFLRWALPRLGLRWAGFRKVRRQVCRRIERRLRALGLDDVTEYRGYLVGHPDEWTHLEAQCRIPISRFFRDRRVFEYLAEKGLPQLARNAHAAGERELRCWSAGCASGEEPYTLALIWAFQLAPAFPEVGLLHLLRYGAAAGRGGCAPQPPGAVRSARPRLARAPARARGGARTCCRSASRGLCSRARMRRESPAWDVRPQRSSAGRFDVRRRLARILLSPHP